MNKHLKKRKLAVSAAALIIFLCYACAIVMISFQFLAQVMDKRIIAEGILCAVVFLFILNRLNNLHDRIEGYANVDPWCGVWAGRSVFSGLLYLYGCAFVCTAARFYDAEEMSTAFVVEGVMLVMVSGAVCLQIYNGVFFNSRKSRIRRLIRKTHLNGKRTFSMVIEKGELKDGESIVHGHLQGEIHKGDRVLIYHSDTKPHPAKVRTIISNHIKVRHFKGGDCQLVLYSDKKEGRLSVLSGSREISEAKKENNVSAVMLRTYLYEYRDRYRDPVYWEHLLKAVMSAHYLVPGFYQNGRSKGRDVMDNPQGSVIAFPSVNNKEHPEEAVLAVFTDWDAAARWKDLMAGADAASTVLDFDQVLQLEKAGYRGIVVNPFGPVPFYLNKELTDGIVRSEEYQNRHIVKTNENE